MRMVELIEKKKNKNNLKTENNSVEFFTQVI